MKKLSTYLQIFRSHLYYQFFTDELFKLLSLDQFLCADEKHDKLIEVINSNKDKPGALIQVLHEAQEIYGYLPLMTFSHCPKKSINNGKCVSCKGEDLSIKDETGKVFLLRNYRIKYCYSQLLNCNVLDNISECKKRGVKNKFVDLIGVGGDAKEILMSLKNGKSNSLNSTHGYFNKKLL